MHTYTYKFYSDYFFDFRIYALRKFLKWFFIKRHTYYGKIYKNHFLNKKSNHLGAELGARDNFCDNATMSRSRKIAACRVVANYSKIVALSLSRRKIVANFRDIRLKN